MKKLILLVIMLTNLLLVNAQTDTVMYISQMQGNVYNICFNQHERVIIYAPDGCTSTEWLINYNQYLTDNYVILDGNDLGSYSVQFVGGNCGQYSTLLYFVYPTTPEGNTTTHWKHQYEPITLEAVGADSADMYTYYWPHSGETTRTVDVTNQGTYTCSISDQCATVTRTKIVNENVEIDLATCDLESNLNLVTWQTNPAQAQYIDHVIVKRDGLQVGIADYSEGQFTDNIGSGSASRTYTLTAVATDGTECPIVSYPKETIHMAYLTGINNTIEVNWNIPAGYDLLGYNICEWHENDGLLSVIDYVGASVTSYTCSQSQFNKGYIVVQGVEAGKDGETRLLSNRSLDLVGLGENGPSTGSGTAGTLTVYPNPTNGVFTVEGAGIMTVTNTLGQTILTKEIDGKTTVELPQGMYFVRLDDVVRKIVVE